MNTEQKAGGFILPQSDCEKGPSKLEAFTMAAMQGLLSGLWAAGGVLGHGWSSEEIAAEAIEQAKATL